jgi:hypothetical protein
MGMLDRFPDLDDKSFEELVNEARSLIPLYAPLWTDHNIHDPGITFIELFAWLAEMQMYHLNRVTDANYKKFLKLIGLHQLPAQPARVDITFEDVKIKTEVEEGTEVVAEVRGEKIVFITEEKFTLISANIESVKTTYDSHIIDNTEANRKDGVYFAAFGEKAPQGATLELGLAFEEPLVQNEIKINVVLFEDDLEPSGSHADEPPIVFSSVKILWEYWKNGKWNELTIKEEDTTQALTRNGRIVFDAPYMDKRDDLYWIRCRLKEGRYEIPPVIDMILLNTIPAIQIKTIIDEDYSKGIPEQKMQLGKPVLNSLLIKVQEKEWIKVDDFESSGPENHHYTFDAEKGEITFGNGLNGIIPPEFEKITASYETTFGSKGNLPKGQSWEIREGLKSIKGTNKREASEGRDAESIEHAKARAKKYFRDIHRAITSNDFEELALSTPGLRVARTKAIPNYNPEYPCVTVPGTVTVVVVPYTREGAVPPLPGEDFRRTVLKHLDKHRLITTDVHVIEPEYIKISIKCKVRALKKSNPSEVERRVKEKLKSFLDSEIWPFGRAIFPSEIYQNIDEVDGVDYATDISIRAEGTQYCVPFQKDAIKISPYGLVYSGEHQVEFL